MVDCSVNLFRSSVFLEKSSQYSLSSDPKDLSGHSALQSTSTFTCSSVSTKSFGL